MIWFRRSAHLGDELSAFADEELGERARRAVEKHLATCEACSTLLIELQDTKALLGELPKLEPRRSLALGLEYAAERRAAPTPRRTSFTFAPAVALTFLVALLFVDAIDSTGGSDNDSAGVTAASRAVEQPETAAELANGSAPAGGEGGAAVGAADSSVPRDGSAPEAAGAAPAPNSDSPSETTGGAPVQPSLDPTPQPEQAFAPLESQTPSDDDESLSQADKAETEPATAGPEETGQLLDASDSSGGPSTLRILEILAALAFAASLLIVILPRITGRQER